MKIALLVLLSVIYDPHKTDGTDPSQTTVCGCKWNMVKSDCEPSILDCEVWE